MVIEQGPNYALAKRLQQWFAITTRARGQKTVINIAPSTTTHSVVKNPILKAAFSGADLFKVETFSPETTNAIMAALWVHDLNNPESATNPKKYWIIHLISSWKMLITAVCGMFHILLEQHYHLQQLTVG